LANIEVCSTIELLNVIKMHGEHSVKIEVYIALRMLKNFQQNMMPIKIP
jgi:hypothetical protein